MAPKSTTTPGSVDHAGSRRTLFTVAACILVCILAFLLRSRYLEWGVPGFVQFQGREVQNFQPDEPVFVSQMSESLKSGNLFRLYDAKYGPANTLLAFPFIKAASRLSTELNVYLACRWVSVISSTLAVLVVFLTGLFWNRRTALLGSLFLAVTMIHARDARWADPDPLCGLFILGTLYFCFRALQRPSGWNDVLGGACLALGTATKAFALLFLHLPFLVVFLASRRESSGKDGDLPRTFRFRTVLWILWTAAGLALLSSLLLRPLRGVVLAFGKGLLASLYESDPGGLGHGKTLLFWFQRLEDLYPVFASLVLGVAIGLTLIALLATLLGRCLRLRPFFERFRFLLCRRAWGFVAAFLVTCALLFGPSLLLNPVGFYNFISHHLAWAGESGKFGTYPACVSVPSYFGSFLPVAMGWPLYLLGIAGILLTLRQRDKRSLLVLLGILPYWLVLELNRFHTLRFSLPLLPGICLLASFFLCAGFASGSRAVRGLAAGILAFALCASFIYTAAFVQAIDPSREPRIAAGQWVLENVEQGTSLGVRGYNVHRWSIRPLDDLEGFPAVAYEDAPEYAVISEISWRIMEQFLDLQGGGCAYGEKDWWPLEPPSEAQVAAYADLIRERAYVCLETMKNPTSFLGVSFEPCVLPFEHICTVTNPAMRIYRKRPSEGRP